MPAGKQYTVLHRFERVDPHTGETTAYEVGDTYAGVDADKYAADPNIYAPDHGPLIGEKSEEPAKAARADAADSAKEK
jgi:hypothetical protein